MDLVSILIFLVNFRSFLSHLNIFSLSNSYLVIQYLS